MEHTIERWKKWNGYLWRHIATVVKGDLAITYVDGIARFYYVN